MRAEVEDVIKSNINTFPLAYSVTRFEAMLEDLGVESPMRKAYAGALLFQKAAREKEPEFAQRAYTYTLEAIADIPLRGDDTMYGIHALTTILVAQTRAEDLYPLEDVVSTLSSLTDFIQNPTRQELYTGNQYILGWLAGMLTVFTNRFREVDEQIPALDTFVKKVSEEAQVPLLTGEFQGHTPTSMERADVFANDLFSHLYQANRGVSFVAASTILYFMHASRSPVLPWIYLENPGAKAALDTVLEYEQEQDDIFY